MHMIWSEGLAGQVWYPVTELVVTSRDKATLFTVKGVTDGKPRLTPFAILRKVWGIQPISQEEGVPPFLGPQLRPVDCGRQHRLRLSDLSDSLNRKRYRGGRSR